MPLNNRLGWSALALFTACSGSVGLAAPLPTPPQSAPSVPPAPDATPPANMPSGAGPSATSGTPDAAERYDQVGYASWYGDELRGHRTADGDAFDPDGITAASRDLPMGSFAEVTSLDSGKTILVEITDRGPTRPDRLIDLSHGAAKLLGVDGASIAPVRVRRVDPPAADQAALKRGQAASPRLDSPAVLLAGLRARLPEPAKRASPTMSDPAIVAIKAPPPATRLVAPPAARPTPAATKPGPKPPASSASGHGYYVQVGTFSTEANARGLAGRLHGHVNPAGKYWQVRLGPFADRAAADTARDGVAKRGYGDARVLHKD